MSENNTKFFFLIVNAKDKLSSPGSPSNRAVLQLYCHHRFVSNKSILESGKLVIAECLIQYNKFEIPVISESNAVRKLTDLRNKWTNINKRKKRRTAKDIENEKKFLQVLDQLFDITPKNVLFLFESDDSKAFYISQKNNVRLRPKHRNSKDQGSHLLIL